MGCPRSLVWTLICWFAAHGVTLFSSSSNVHSELATDQQQRVEVAEFAPDGAINMQNAGDSVVKLGTTGLVQSGAIDVIEYYHKDSPVPTGMENASYMYPISSESWKSLFFTLSTNANMQSTCVCVVIIFVIAVLVCKGLAPSKEVKVDSNAHVTFTFSTQSEGTRRPVLVRSCLWDLGGARDFMKDEDACAEVMTDWILGDNSCDVRAEAPELYVFCLHRVTEVALLRIKLYLKQALGDDFSLVCDSQLGSPPSVDIAKIQFVILVFAKIDGANVIDLRVSAQRAKGAVAMGFTNVPFGIDGGSLLKRLKKFENLDLVVAMGPLGAQTGSVNVKPLPEQAARSTPLDQDTKSLVASDLFSVLYGGGISKCLACRSCPPTREGSGAWEGWHLPAFALFEIERPKV